LDNEKFENNIDNNNIDDKGKVIDIENYNEIIVQKNKLELEKFESKGK
jgi:hypothetical protein